jgi:hypothetical protein
VGLDRLGMIERRGGLAFAQRGDLILTLDEPFASVYVAWDWRMLGATEGDKVQWFMRDDAPFSSTLLTF